MLMVKGKEKCTKWISEQVYTGDKRVPEGGEETTLTKRSKD